MMKRLRHFNQESAGICVADGGSYSIYEHKDDEEYIYQGFGELLRLANGRQALCLLYVERDQIYLSIDTMHFLIDENIDIAVDSKFLHYILILSKGDGILYTQSFRKDIGEVLLSIIDATYDEFDRERHFIYFLGTHLGDKEWRSFFIATYGKAVQ